MWFTVSLVCHICPLIRLKKIPLGQFAININTDIRVFCMCNQFTSRGFTLLELMVTLLVIGIFVSLSAPSIGLMFQKNAVDTPTKGLARSIKYAKNEAVLRGLSVSICASSTGNSCEGNWRNGWIVYVNGDGAGNYSDRPNSGDVILQVNGRVDGNVNINWNQTSDRLTFNNRGFMVGSNAGTFTVCPLNNDSTIARAVIVNTVGAVRRSIDVDGDGTHESGDGDEISCPA